MARTITIKLTGLAEKFIQEMERQGLNEADVIAQGIGILEEIWRTNRVALVKEEFYINSRQYNKDETVLERYYHIQTPEMMKKETPKIPTPENMESNPFRRGSGKLDFGESPQDINT